MVPPSETSKPSRAYGVGRMSVARPDMLIGITADESQPADYSLPRPAPGAPNVVVTGAQLFDNKGQIVEQFEPYFSSGFAYVAPGETERGLASRVFYDPRGLAVRTLHALYGLDK